MKGRMLFVKVFLKAIVAPVTQFFMLNSSNARTCLNNLRAWEVKCMLSNKVVSHNKRPSLYISIASVKTSSVSWCESNQETMVLVLYRLGHSRK